MNLKEKYADLIVRSGLNVQKDQIVVVRANVEMNEFVRLIVKSCFVYLIKKCLGIFTHRMRAAMSTATTTA